EIGQEQITLARDRWLYRRGLARVDRIVAQNPFQLESCRRNHQREALVIPSCYVPAAHARRASLEHDCVLWVGTIHDYKRPHWFLDIAERLPHRRVVMIGGPSIGGEGPSGAARAETMLLGSALWEWARHDCLGPGGRNLPGAEVRARVGGHLGGLG